MRPSLDLGPLSQNDLKVPNANEFIQKKNITEGKTAYHRDARKGT
jgi:hypothetical protein